VKAHLSSVANTSSFLIVTSSIGGRQGVWNGVHNLINELSYQEIPEGKHMGDCGVLSGILEA
jgi:hypothetical protein